MGAYVPFVLAPLIALGIRGYLVQRNDYTQLKKRTLVLAIVAFLVTELGRGFYRPYIYAHGIDDGFIADTIGNTFGSMTVIFAVITVSGSGTRRDWWLIGMVASGLLAYEASNLAGHHPFDLNDVLATLLFSGFSAVIYGFILRRYGKQLTDEARPPMVSNVNQHGVDEGESE